MAIHTKEDVLRQIMNSPFPVCPHCGKTMSVWEAPPMNFSDGLGWGEPYLFVCFNDECPPYVSGWEEIESRYSHKASTRCICYPSSRNYEFMPVFSRFGATGQIVDQDLLDQQEKEKERIKQGFAALAQAYADKDGAPALAFVLDGAAPGRVRMKAAEMLEDLGKVEDIEPLMNKKFATPLLADAVKKAVGKIHERNFTMECPHCAEVVKRRAKVCKHCGKDIHG